jgi:hypothetical protein
MKILVPLSLVVTAVALVSGFAALQKLQKRQTVYTS